MNASEFDRTITWAKKNTGLRSDARVSAARDYMVGGMGLREAARKHGFSHSAVRTMVQNIEKYNRKMKKG
jgi:transposase